MDHIKILDQNSDKTNTLYKQIKQCTVCSAHLPLPPNPIIQLNEQADILIIGQAPGIKPMKVAKLGMTPAVNVYANGLTWMRLNFITLKK